MKTSQIKAYGVSRLNGLRRELSRPRPAPSAPLRGSERGRSGAETPHHEQTAYGQNHEPMSNGNENPGVMWDRIGHRRSPRYPLSLPCSYQLHVSVRAGLPAAMSAAQAGAGRTCSLSDRGACLELAEVFPPATRLLLTLEVSREGLPLEAEVVWVRAPRQPGGSSLHGVHFHAVTPAQQQALQTLLLHF